MPSSSASGTGFKLLQVRLREVGRLSQREFRQNIGWGRNVRGKIYALTKDTVFAGFAQAWAGGGGLWIEKLAIEVSFRRCGLCRGFLELLAQHATGENFLSNSCWKRQKTFCKRQTRVRSFYSARSVRSSTLSCPGITCMQPTYEIWSLEAQDTTLEEGLEVDWWRLPWKEGAHWTWDPARVPRTKSPHRQSQRLLWPPVRRRVYLPLSTNVYSARFRNRWPRGGG